MSFDTFFAVTTSRESINCDEYAADVATGHCLAESLSARIGSDEPVKRAFVLAQLVVAINRPMKVLKHLAEYFALEGNYWLAGKLLKTYREQQGSRRKGARQTNEQASKERAQWRQVAAEVARKLLEAEQGGPIRSWRELAARVEKHPDFRSLGERRPSTSTLRQALPKLASRVSN